MCLDLAAANAASGKGHWQSIDVLHTHVRPQQLLQTVHLNQGRSGFGTG
jgi:hypothetical protein